MTDSTPWAAQAPLRVLVGAAAVAAVLFEALLTWVPAPLWARTGALYAVQVTVLACAAASARGRRHREQGRGRLAWGLIATGLAVVCVSNAVGGWYAVVLRDVSAVSWRDSLSALGLLAFAAGLLALCGRAPLTSRTTSLLDTVMAAGACLYVLWQTLLTPRPGTASDRQQQVLYSYVGGMAVILLLALLFAARWRGDHRTMRLIGAGLGVEVVVLVGLAVLSSQGHHVAMSDPRVGAVFPLGSALIGLAAAQRPAGPWAWVPLRRQWDLALGLPLASGALVLVTVVGLTLLDRPPSHAAIALAGFVGALISVRQGQTLLDNRRLTLHLEQVVSERTAALEASRRHFRDVVQHSSDLIVVLAADGRITYTSPAVTDVLGYTERALLGRPAADLVHPDDLERVRTGAAGLPTADGAVTAFRAAHADGSWRSVEAIVGQTAEGTFVVNVRDVTDRQLLEERLRYQAYHDPLTGLANRALMQERMRHALLRARRTQESTALVFVDLDDFKRLNDTAGHSAGDEALVHVADVIRSCIRPHDTAARLGGDEFAVLLEDADEEHGTAVADRIVQALQHLPIPRQRTYVAGASVGVSVADAGRTDGESLLRDADIAMYQAKSSGRGRAAVFHPGMREQLVRELALESALRAALDEGALRVVYQPIVDLDSRQPRGVEALVRWQDAQGQEVPPSLFIPLAEQVGLIGVLDAWVLERACRDIAGSDTLEGLSLNVNLSARDFDDRIEDRVVAALGVSRLDPRRLMLEITETAVLPDLGSLTLTLQALRTRGTRVSLDDFGTGYSSMASLRQLPLDEIKIDGSFVAGLPEGASAARVVEGIIGMARSLGLPVVAEAVESEDVAEHLQRFQCDAAQGWHFAPPMPIEDLECWVRDRVDIRV